MKSKYLRFFLFVVLLFFCILFMVLVAPGPLKHNKVVIIKKDSLFNVSGRLKEEGVVSNKFMFFVIAELHNVFKSLKAGEYEFPSKSSILRIVHTMQAGKFFNRSITIPEGYTTCQILKIIHREPNLFGVLEQERYKEGMLLPETYFFIRGEKKEGLVHEMSNAMERTLNEAWENRDKTLPLENKSKLLILASIVEKEAKFDDERTKIASVFINRIRKGMRLESDPTTIYAITKGRYILNRPLKKKELKMDSPFNTYMKYGLPPMPIANPGLNSIKAVANPMKSSYLYFVVKNCEGRHNFSDNMKQHNLYVREYRRLKCGG